MNPLSSSEAAMLILIGSFHKLVALIIPLFPLILIPPSGSPVLFAQTQSNDTDQLLEKGEAFYEQGDHVQAIAHYNEILSIDPNHTGAIYDKGLSLDVLGKHEDAIAHYDMVLSVEPNNINALVNKAGALGDLGNYEEAIEHFDRALSLDPNNDLAISNKRLAESLLSNTTTG